ncbi:MAG: molybdopterin molybdotransferase MoeA, partial [Bryobacteraceae bacterium]
MPSFEEARRKIIQVTQGLDRREARNSVALDAALGRILAERIVSDRDYPPFHRSARDGFALRAADLGESGGTLACIGEIRAGQGFEGSVRAGECVQIMTGAAVPEGADSVVMIEYTRESIEDSRPRIHFERGAEKGQNIVPRGSESHSGQLLLSSGARLGYPELAIAAQVGKPVLSVFARPRVAILSTGDEVVAVDAPPGPLQIRNGNGVSIAAQVQLAGGEPFSLGNAPDTEGAIRTKIERGLAEDALVISGGVSKGKYDLVEPVLAGLGAEFHMDEVDIRPGKPAVFGVCQGRPVFGLPGNPGSTMVTFELFVLPAIDILSGTAPRALPVLRAKLA